MLMTDTVIPIRRHNDTSETVIVCRGKVREEFYDAEGKYGLTMGPVVNDQLILRKERDSNP